MKKEDKKKGRARSEDKENVPSSNSESGFVCDFFIQNDHKKEKSNSSIKEQYVKKRRNKVKQKDQSVSFFLPEIFEPEDE